MHETSRSNPTDFALVLHFHQPVGNFDHVFSSVTDRCYAPLLEVLSNFPEVKTHLHFNEILLEWFDGNRPELIALIGELVRGGSVELLTGGLREPILTVLPEDDAVGQVRALSDRLEERFGSRPVGAWLTERVWEPRLPTPLARAGVRYVTLDDVIFHWAGVGESQCHQGHLVTDDAGHPLALFPAAKSLRYTIPFRPHAETFDLLDSLEGDAPLLVYADDAEKFGGWPGTHEWVYGKGWLKEFFEQLRDDDRVRTVHLADRIALHQPVDRVYPPTASYPEMTIWAMSTPARSRMESVIHELEVADPLRILPELRGAHWRGFLGKYPEVHRLHKRMLRVSRRARSLRERGETGEAMDRAVADLYRGQCNDAYWHGAFGGVYLPHLRRAVESYLIRAERALDRLEHGGREFERSDLVDLDADGVPEVELATGHGHVVVDPSEGALLSWDLRDACDNWVTVMQRHEEPFHADLREGRVIQVDDDGLPLDPPTDEGGVSTIHGAVRVKPGVEAADLEVDLHSRAAGLLWSGAVEDRPIVPTLVERSAIRLDGWTAEIEPGEAACSLRGEGGGLKLVQRLHLSCEEPRLAWRAEVEALDGPRILHAEWNLFVGWTGGDLECDDGQSFVPRASGELPLARSMRFRGGGDRELRIESGGGGQLSWQPVYTVSSSEAGLERIGQGTCFVFSWVIDRSRTLELSFTALAPPLGDEVEPG